MFHLGWFVGYGYGVQTWRGQWSGTGATDWMKPDTYIDLGHFYQQHQRYEEAEAALQVGIRQDHAHDDALVDAASILTDAHRNPQLARQLLREYLASPEKSESAPAFRVHVQLGKLLASDGDKAGAKSEYLAALALASKYSEAQKALQKL